MAAPVYKASAFPHFVGGPGPIDTLALAVTATGATSSNPVLAQADMAAYNAASANDKARHDRFSAIVSAFTVYGNPVSLASNGSDTITMTFEQKGMFANSSLGKPGFFSYGHRPNAYDLAAAFVAANDHTVTVLTTTLNTVLQNAT